MYQNRRTLVQVKLKLIETYFFESFQFTASKYTLDSNDVGE